MFSMCVPMSPTVLPMPVNFGSVRQMPEFTSPSRESSSSSQSCTYSALTETMSPMSPRPIIWRMTFTML